MNRRPLARMTMGLAMTAAACGGTVSVADTDEVTSTALRTSPEEVTTTTPTTATAPTVAPVRVQLPVLAPIALPDLTEMNATGELVTEQLGELAGSASGVDVVGATCEAEGGELTYAGSTESALFDTAPDGSGTYYRENDDGLVTLDMATDGSGEYYDRDSTGVLTIKATGDGSGEYYNDRNGGLTTVKVTGTGTGEYYHRDDALVTITIDETGRGEYFARTDAGLVTVAAAPDGSGVYYDNRDGLETIDMKANGSWTYVRVVDDMRVELDIAVDGSGHYRRTGSAPLELDIEPGGHVVGHRFEMPDPPEFLVDSQFPPLGALSPLTPTCATIIRFDEQVLFDYDAAELRSDANAVLDEVAKTLNDLGQAVEIAGHTDSHGPEDYNQELSELRADAVFEALRDRGLAVDVTVIGYGETRPLAPNETPSGQDSPAGRQLNRRVEIVIPEG